MEVLDSILSILYGAGAHLVLGLIALDVVFGIAAALRTEEFEWGKVLTFYKTMILPDFLGYAALYAVNMLVPDLIGTFFDVALASIAFAHITQKLVKSILGNVAELGWELSG